MGTRSAYSSAIVLAATGSDPRRVLGTGLIGSFVLTVMLVAAVAAFAGPIDQMLIGTDAWFPVVAATLLGGMDGSFRLASMIARFERRPVMYVVLVAVYGIAGLIAAIALIEAGYGLEGAIGGLALGSAVAMLCGLWVSRHRFSLALDLEQLPVLAKVGFPMAGIIVGRFVFQYLWLAAVWMIVALVLLRDVLIRLAPRVRACRIA